MDSLHSVAQSRKLAAWASNFAQVILISLIWLVAGKIAITLKIPLSGGVLGLLILVVLLMTKVVHPAYLENGAEILLTNMMLYFIPLVVSIIKYFFLFQSSGLKLMIAISVGFVVVMVATAATVEWFCRWTRKRLLKSHLAVRKGRSATRHPGQLF